MASMKVKVIRKGGEMLELDLSPTDLIAQPLGTTIIGPDHYSKLVEKFANASDSSKVKASKVAALFGAVAADSIE